MHNCGDFVWPKSNKEYWQTKSEKNRKRDEANIKALQDSGWYVIVVWECELKTFQSGEEKMNQVANDIIEHTLYKG